MCNGGPCKIVTVESVAVEMGITENFGAPNLDGYNKDTLMDFWNVARHGRKMAKLLFSGKPKNYVKVTQTLANYASNKATAMACRERGDIQAALIYEKICNNIYTDLPEWARW